MAEQLYLRQENMREHVLIPALTLAEQDMADSSVHVIVDWVAAVDHQTVHELHGLGPLAPELAGHNHLTALGSALHDEAENTIAGPGEDNDNQSAMLLQITCISRPRDQSNSSQTNASMSSTERDTAL